MPPRTVADHVADPRHAGAIEGASLAGEAEGGSRLLVRLGLWLDRDARVSRARYRATTCASLIAYAEAACALAEAGEDVSRLDATRLRSAVAGVHPVHHDRADLVALALARALARSRSETRGIPVQNGAHP
jgi:NifU-like protein involved in Fe-S cluster formation